MKDRAPGAPLVSSRLWADDPDGLPNDGILVDFVQDASQDDARNLARPSESERLTLVNSPVSPRVMRLPPLIVPVG